MKAPEKKPKVKLTGSDSHALSIMNKIKRALRTAGADKEYCDKFQNEALAGDHNHVIQTAMKYAEVL